MPSCAPQEPSMFERPDPEREQSPAKREGGEGRRVSRSFDRRGSARPDTVEVESVSIKAPVVFNCRNLRQTNNRVERHQHAKLAFLALWRCRRCSRHIVLCCTYSSTLRMPVYGLICKLGSTDVALKKVYHCFGMRLQWLRCCRSSFGVSMLFTLLFADTHRRSRIRIVVCGCGPDLHASSFDESARNLACKLSGLSCSSN